MIRAFRLLSVFVGLLVVVSTARGEAVVEGNNVTFRLDCREWNDKPNRVNVAGSFNGWSKDQTALADADGDLVWETTVKLEDGQHAYKFVIDGERWINDPQPDEQMNSDDGQGGTNNGVLVGPDIRKAEPPQANAINESFVRHDPDDVRDASVTDDGRLRLQVRAQAGDVGGAVAEVGGQEFVLSKMAAAGGYDSFAGLIPADGGKYQIVLIDDAAKQKVPAEATALPAMRGDVPEWAKDAVWYQIFPERFRNGEPANDPGDAEFETLVPWTINWWQPQLEQGEVAGDENFYRGHGNAWRRRFGGDIQGVRWALPYLRKLGVNAIYLNPVFEAESMHKYDTADFRHIDDNFGKKERRADSIDGQNGDATGSSETDDPATWKWTESDRIFLEFLDDAHRQGFKVIIDGVFNHVGRAHPFFMDVLEKGKNSPYAEWFEITDWGNEANWRKMDKPFEIHGKPGGIQWRAWDGDSGHLPVFKKDAQLGLARGPREHILAITKRWLAPDGDASRGIDGWRLDVANDIPHPFWRDWHKLVKSTKPDAYISGEIWSLAQPWINDGDQFDAVMNYPFAMAAQNFFVNQQKQIKPSEFAARLGELQMVYPFQNALVMQNLFDSHDTDRVASMFVNPDRPYDGANRPQDNAANWPYSAQKPDDQQWQRLKQAAVCQFTFVGAPMIYYGTEAGMWSPDDPSNRQPMIWADLMPYADPQVSFKQDLFDHYQRLMAVREQLKPLRHGFFVPLLTDDQNGLMVYQRSDGDEHVYVALNRSDREQEIEIPVASDDATMIDYLDPKQAVQQVDDQGDDATARPKVKAVEGEGYKAANGKIRLHLPAYGSAILAKP